MLLLPRTGATGESLLTALTHVSNTAMNAASGGQIVESYLGWVSESVRTLRHAMRPEDLDRVLLTPRYWATLHSPIDSRAVNAAVSDEVHARQTDLREATESLRRELGRWNVLLDAPLHIVVPDTNVFLEHDQMIDAVDWHGLVSSAVRALDQIVLVVPLLVVDELDNAKRDRIRSRARQTLKLLFDQFQADPSARSTLIPAGRERGRISVELRFDEPAHVRLANPDDELVERCVALQALTGRPVNFVSFDTGAVFRALAAGLPGHRLDRPTA